MLNIAIIIGSVRDGRHTQKVAHYLNEVLDRFSELQVTLLDLAEYQLPLFTERWADQDNPDVTLKSFSEILHNADAVVLCSPEYHGSYTGVLKNALDHFWKEFYRKPIGVVATGSGHHGGINASIEMQHLILSLGAFPMPTKLLVPFVSRAFDLDGQPKEEKMVLATKKFAEELVWFTGALAAAREPART